MTLLQGDRHLERLLIRMQAPEKLSRSPIQYFTEQMLRIIQSVHLNSALQQQ